MTTPPNTPVSDARLAELALETASRARSAKSAIVTDTVYALIELQARRAADATREPAPVLRRQLSGFGWEARVDGERMVLIKADAADLLHERYGVLAGSLDLIAKGVADPAEVAKAGLKASDEIRASMRSSEPTPGVVEALRDATDALERTMAPTAELPKRLRAALATHDAAQEQRDPVQAVQQKPRVKCSAGCDRGVAEHDSPTVGMWVGCAHCGNTGWEPDHEAEIVERALQAVLAEVVALVAPFVPPPPTGRGMKVPRDGAWPTARKELLDHIADAVLQVVEKDASERHNDMADQLDREEREKGAAT